MQTASTVSNIPQSIANTVTVFDAKEVARRDKEAARTEAWLNERIESGKTGEFAEPVTITPVLADVLLRRNLDNRRVRLSRVIEIKNDLERGHWTFNGEPIILSREGLLNDGQHRLLAVSQTGKSIRSMIVFGVQRSSRTTVNQGTVRTVADYLEMDGHREDPTTVAAIARMIFQYDGSGTIETRAIKHKFRPTKTDIRNTAEVAADEIGRSLKQVGSGSKALGSRSLLAFAHHLFARKDRDAADFFMGRLIDSANLAQNSPILVLRNRLIAAPDMPPHERLELIIRAWNAHRSNASVHQFKVMGRGLPKVEG